MKKTKQTLLLTAFAVLTICSLNSCLGDKGNMTTSYGTGTILTLNNTPCIRLDEINLNITGAGIPTLNDSIARAMVYYTIDWDNQTANAEAQGIYEAAFSNIATWGISDYTEGFPTEFDFKATDTLRAIAQPFVTTGTDITPNMLTMNVRLYAGEGSVKLIQKNIPADPNYMGMSTDTLIIAYEGAERSGETRDEWYTFELPDYPSNITSITLLYRSVSHSGFTSVWKQDLGGYIYTMSTKFTD